MVSNRRKPLINKFAYIRNIAMEEMLYIPIKEDWYKAIEVEPKIKLHNVIDRSILGCQKKKQREYYRLRKIIELHNKALEQNDCDDGFVNLWSIMEVVSSDMTGDTKIEKVINSVLSILQNDYYSKYFQSLRNDLRSSLRKEEYIDIVDGITEKGDEVYKIACLTLLDKYRELREELFTKLKGYPNIRYKMWRMYRMRNNKKEIFKYSNGYGRRLKWHTYRLYRMRNKIVHSGEKDKNVRILGEHLHIYCDGIIIELIVKLSNESFETIRDVLVDTRLLLESKKELFNDTSAVQERDITNMFSNYLNKLVY